MTYVIALPCVDLKDRACIDECPVDCIYEGDSMLYIHPDECVDCGACEPVCPVEAIYYEDDLPAQWSDYYEAVEFFSAVPSIREKFATLQRVGLGYVKVGQPATTLSGGEAQRVKLSKELSKRATGRTLYMLDEPTTGLHFHDVAKLLEVLHELVEGGNTVLVIEHNLEVIKTADWVIDMGPEGGDGGGEVVAIGTPEDIAESPRSHTGRFLKEVMGRRLQKSAAAE